MTQYRNIPRILVAWLLSVCGLSYVAPASAYVGAAATDWAFQQAMNKIVLSPMAGPAITIGAAFARNNPWIRALSVGLSLARVQVDTNSSTAPALDLYPVTTQICFAQPSNTYCQPAANTAPNGQGWRYTGGPFKSNPMEACKSVPTSENLNRYYMLNSTTARCQAVWDVANDWRTAVYLQALNGQPQPVSTTPPTVTPNGYPGLMPAYPGWTNNAADGDPALGTQTTGGGPRPTSYGNPGLFERESTDSDGLKHRQSITPLPNGGIRISTDNEYLDSNGNKRHMEQTLEIGPTGVATSVNEADHEGSVPLPTGTPGPQTTSQTPPEIKLETCGLPGKPACLIDEQASLSSAATTAATTAGTAASTAIDSQTTKFNAAAAGGNAGAVGIGGLSQWSAPTTAQTMGIDPSEMSGSSCSVQSVSFMGKSMPLDYCPIVNGLRPYLNWGAAMLTAMYIFSLAYRRNSREA